MRCKGIPPTTIDEHGNTIKLLNRETYEELFKNGMKLQETMKKIKNSDEYNLMSKEKQYNTIEIYIKKVIKLKNRILH